MSKVITSGIAQLSASIIGWFLRVLGVTFDLRELIAVLFGSGSSGGSSMAGIIGQGTYPTWFTVVVPLGVFVVTAILLALILGRFRRGDRLATLPHVLGQMNSRLSHLAKKQSKVLLSKDTTKLGKDLADLVGITQKQLNAIQDKVRIHTQSEKAMRRKAEKAIAGNLPEFLDKLVTVTEKHDTGLLDIAHRDFRYMFYERQFKNLQPVADIVIHDEAQAYLTFSVGLNTFLMLQHERLSEIDQRLSSETSVENRRYQEILQRKMNRQLVTVRMNIDEYLKRSKANE